MRFKGGTATIRSGGRLPFDAYMLRVVPGGRWRWVEITGNDDLVLVKEYVYPILDRVPTSELMPRFMPLQKRQGTPLSVRQFLETETKLDLPMPSGKIWKDDPPRRGEDHRIVPRGKGLGVGWRPQ